MFIPPAAFDDERASRTASATTPLLRRSFEKALPPTPSSFKKRIGRPRFLGTRRRRPVSYGGEVNGLTYERSAREDVSSETGSGEVPIMGGEQGKDEKADRVIKGKKFLQWVRQRERERKAAEETLESAKEEEQYFRCDIFATSSTDFSEASREYKQRVIEAGGAILEDHECLPGFMYTLPPDFAGPPPLETSGKTSRGGHIRVSPRKKYMYRQSPPQETFQEFLRAGSASARRAKPSDELYISTSRPISPLTPHTTKNPARNMSPVSPPRLRSIRSYFNHSTESKEWPRPKDSAATKRSGDWVKTQAARRTERLNEELKSSLGMEVVMESMYEGGVEAGGLYLDGFNDLAVWMDAGGPVPCEGPEESTLWI